MLPARLPACSPALMSSCPPALLPSCPAQAGARFERAQVVRLDARWIAMLRYHLGSLFEDIWVPASGETDPHLGNTLPAQARQTAC